MLIIYIIIGFLSITHLEYKKLNHEKLNCTAYIKKKLIKYLIINFIELYILVDLHFLLDYHYFHYQ